MPERSKDESELPYIRLLLEADLYQAKGHSWNLSIDEVKGLLDDVASGLSMPFEAVYPSTLGIVARQTSSLYRYEAFGLTWIFGRGLQCEIWVPINTFASDDPSHLLLNLGKYQHADRFLQALESKKTSDSKILDLNQIFQVLQATSNMYLKFLRKAGVDVEKVYAKAILGSIWHTIPFFDSSIMLDRIDKYGLPLSLTDDSIVPGGHDADSFSEVTLFDNSTGETVHPVGCAIEFFELICRALGLQGILPDTRNVADCILLTEELHEAWERSTR